MSKNEKQKNNADLLFLTKEKGENMKGITKRNDGRYMIRKTIDNQRITKYAKTIAEAKIILKNMLLGKIKPTKKEHIKNYTLEQYSTLWLELYKKPFVKAKSYSEIKGFVNKFNQKIGQIYLKDITTDTLQQFMNTMQRNRRKEKTAMYLNAVLQKAVDTGIILKNPFKAVIKDKKMKCKNNAYTYTEQVKILNAIKRTDIEHEIIIYLMCGCRPKELPTKQNFDFENNIINIHGTKNDNALHREVEMSQNFASYIKQYLQTNEIKPELYVSRKFTQICNNIGIEKPLLYRLRHTFATNHFTLGTQPKYVQIWLGHSEISMTLDTYTDIDRTATKEKIKKLYNNFYYIKDEI